MQFENQRQAVEAHIPTAQEFYRNLLRCGYYMPAETAQCCTIDFFDWTVRKLVWVPLMNQVRPIAIASPPPAKVLKETLIRSLDSGWL